MSAVIQSIISPRESEEGRPTLAHQKGPAIHDVDFKHSLSVFRKLGTVVLFYVLASVYYANVEGWSTTDCIYFLTVSISTVGYGDFHPTNDRSRMFTIFTILVGLIFIFSIISDLANFIISLAEEQAAKIKKQQEFVTIDPWKYWKKRSYTAGMVLLLVFIGTMVMWLHEEWTFIQALYFTIVTVTTVGFGDLEPVKHGSKVFLIFFIPMSVCVVAGALGSLGAIAIEMEADKKKLESLNRKLDFNMIREMDTDGDGVDKCEFLVAMLVQNGICDKENDIDPWLKRFDELDKDGSGRLDGDDIAIMEREEQERLERLQNGLPPTRVPFTTQNLEASAAGRNSPAPRLESQENPLNKHNIDL